MDRWMNGQMDEWMEEYNIYVVPQCILALSPILLLKQVY